MYSALKVCSWRELVTRNGVRIDKARDPADEFDVVARQLGLDHVHFGLDHVLDAKRQVRHGDLVLDAIVHAIDVLVVIAGQVKHRLAEGFARNCACIDTNSANHLATLHQSHAFAHLGALDGRALARRSGADNNKIVGLHRGTNLTHEGSKPHQSAVTIPCQSCQNGIGPGKFYRLRSTRSPCSPPMVLIG